MNKGFSKKTLERVETVKRLKAEGKKPKEIVETLGVTWSAYSRINDIINGKITCVIPDEELIRVEEVKPEAVPVTIKGKKYLDVTSFWM